MKFSEHWLRSVFDPGLSSDELASELTMAGLEVEALEPLAAAFEGVVVARVVELRPHPDAERLKLCVVDMGTEKLQVVCGAPNVRVGMMVACAPSGARLPGMQVERVELRGVASHGMLCSERELGLGEDHGGVMDLGSDGVPGVDLRQALELDDRIFTLKLTPNRGDCLSIHGLARELAALTGGALSIAPPVPVAALVAQQRSVLLEAGDACPRYCGRIVTEMDPNATTPGWMVRRLQRSGVRPITALVDITNYVMLEMGQPLHAFDNERLNGNVLVRFARGGEKLTLLDGRAITLGPEHLVIADELNALALAGVMGGAASAVSQSTTSVFLESAYFAPEAVAAASRGLEIASDAAHRFERGVDFELAPLAIERASELILQICGGKPGPVIEAKSTLPARTGIVFSPDRVRRAIGVDVPNEAMVDILARLGIGVQAHETRLIAAPPSFRFDLAIEADVVEEIARVHGYDRVPASMPVAPSPMLSMPETRASTDQLKLALSRRDYFEVITFSFVDRELERDFTGAEDPIALANPIASQMSVMRSSLIGSLVECVRFNLARKQERVRVFEAAACYRRHEGGYLQTDRIAAVCYGNAMPEQWGVPSRGVDFFDIRGDLEAVWGASELTFAPGEHPSFHPGQCARVLYRGQPAGWVGALNPRLLQKYELPGATVAFELELDVVRERPLPAYGALSRFPLVRRDIALVVDANVQVAELEQAIRRYGGPLVSEVLLFDVYRGKGVPEGRKSLAFRVLLQDTAKTLTDAEVEAAVQRIVGILQEQQGATLRI